MLDRHVAVVDTSVLINLAAAELLPYLGQLFVTVHLPQSVRGEILRWEESSRNSSRISLVDLLHPALFEPCTAGDQANLQILLESLGPGEAETIEQFEHVGAITVLMDESRGRRRAKARGVRPLGTARILAQLHVIGFCDDLQSAIWAMRERGRARIADKTFQTALVLARSGDW